MPSSAAAWEVDRVIIHENAPLGRDADEIEGELIDGRVGLGQPYQLRHDVYVEQVPDADVFVRVERVEAEAVGQQREPMTGRTRGAGERDHPARDGHLRPGPPHQVHRIHVLSEKSGRPLVPLGLPYLADLQRCVELAALRGDR